MYGSRTSPVVAGDTERHMRERTKQRISIDGKVEQQVLGAVAAVKALPAPVRPARVSVLAERIEDPELAEVFARAARAWERWAVRQAAVSVP